MAEAEKKRAGLDLTRIGTVGKAAGLGHGLGPWAEAAFLRGGYTAQCRTCGRSVAWADGVAYGDAVTERCG